jgi:peptidoglycan/xylan/chitin deacetylase (PgdA/CDA1 family)
MRVFTATRPLAFFDHFRVPYRVVATGGDTTPAVTAGGRQLLWPGRDALARAEQPGRDGFRLAGVPIFCAVVDTHAAAQDLARRTPGRSWQPGLPVSTAQGAPVSNVWSAADGSLYLPFDPDDVITAFWSESYARAGRGGRTFSLTAGARWSYYRVRPLIPRQVQVRLRQAFTKVQERASFPRWPTETALLDVFELLFGWMGSVAGHAVPYLAPWPDGYTWALVLTHDVETAAGYRRIDLLRRLEVARGYHSSWNFVPRRYDVEPTLVDDLTRSGFEVGVHGLYHDGRDLESRAMLERRLGEIRRAAQRWQAVGFRSPALQRAEELIPLLPFEYDSSYPDTDPYEPIPGGCCSLLPLFKGPLVELPITLAQDFVLFDLLRSESGKLWLDKAEQVRAHGGMALVLTHPDYMQDTGRLAAYDALLAAYQTDPTCWRALPRAVAAWWRDRAASRAVATGSGWTVSGPAAGRARVTTWAGPERPLRIPG